MLWTERVYDCLIFVRLEALYDDLKVSPMKYVVVSIHLLDVHGVRVDDVRQPK